MSKVNTVEFSQLDLRYETCRMKQPKEEERLLLSILKKGICEPLRGVCIEGVDCLLDGFKRLRCAKRLAITTVPYHCLGNDAAMGIIELMRESLTKGLNVIEQMKLIDTLKTNHGLSLRDIADYLGKSPAWVSIRVVMNRELPPKAARHILAGRFPSRAYLYTILPLTRVNHIKPEKAERFVDRLAGHNLTTRQIDCLAKAYFTGKAEITEQIEKGNLKWALECLSQKQPPQAAACAPFEQKRLQHLERVHTGMLEFKVQPHEVGADSSAFLAQANLLCKGILDNMNPFLETIRRLYDRSQ
jgi:hypothetical protein